VPYTPVSNTFVRKTEEEKATVVCNCQLIISTSHRPGMRRCSSSLTAEQSVDCMAFYCEGCITKKSGSWKNWRCDFCAGALMKYSIQKQNVNCVSYLFICELY
jgi:hypothetical protein